MQNMNVTCCNRCVEESVPASRRTDSPLDLPVFEILGIDNMAAGIARGAGLPIPPETELEEVNRLGAVLVLDLCRW